MFIDADGSKFTSAPHDPALHDKLEVYILIQTGRPVDEDRHRLTWQQCCSNFNEQTLTADIHNLANRCLVKIIFSPSTLHCEPQDVSGAPAAISGIKHWFSTVINLRIPD